MRVSSASASGPTTVTSFVVGMYDEPALTEHDGVGLGVQVDLTAAGAFALLGVTMDELANRVVPAADVCRLNVDRLVDRLLGVPGWPERMAILDETLSRSMASGPRLSPEVAWVDAQLRAHPETARIGDLAEEIGWGRSRLVDRFRREVGLSPENRGSRAPLPPGRRPPHVGSVGSAGSVRPVEFPGRPGGGLGVCRSGAFQP